MRSFPTRTPLPSTVRSEASFASRHVLGSSLLALLSLFTVQALVGGSAVARVIVTLSPAEKTGGPIRWLARLLPLQTHGLLWWIAAAFVLHGLLLLAVLPWYRHLRRVAPDTAEERVATVLAASTGLSIAVFVTTQVALGDYLAFRTSCLLTLLPMIGLLVQRRLGWRSILLGIINLLLGAFVFVALFPGHLFSHGSDTQKLAPLLLLALFVGLVLRATGRRRPAAPHPRTPSPLSQPSVAPVSRPSFPLPLALTFLLCGASTSAFLFSLGRFSTLATPGDLTRLETLRAECSQMELIAPSAPWVPLLRSMACVDLGRFREATTSAGKMWGRMNRGGSTVAWRSRLETMKKVSFVETCADLTRRIEDIEAQLRRRQIAPGEASYLKARAILSANRRCGGHLPSLSDDPRPLIERELLAALEAQDGPHAAARETLQGLDAALATPEAEQG